VPESVSRDASRDFYEEFSPGVGKRDWLRANPRHEQLKLMIADVIGDRRGLRIADVGCATGVMTDYLAGFGTAVGVDFSSPAVEAARRLTTNRAQYVVGSLEALPAGRFDLITAFDVLEHISSDERPGFLKDLAVRLADSGEIFLSTPYPAATAHRRSVGDPTLQIIDEEVELGELIVEAASVGLQLVRFEAFDIWRGSPEYQAMVFVKKLSWGDKPRLRSPRLARRQRIMERRSTRFARRCGLATRAVLRRDLGTAIWFLREREHDFES
jgi:2-polyprenyl-3-methyl-5-hydroxy-6-metoxy-1,4-benzoquinol methylase